MASFFLFSFFPHRSLETEYQTKPASKSSGKFLCALRRLSEFSPLSLLKHFRCLTDRRWPYFTLIMTDERRVYGLLDWLLPFESQSTVKITRGRNRVYQGQVNMIYCSCHTSFDVGTGLGQMKLNDPGGQKL